MNTKSPIFHRIFKSCLSTALLGLFFSPFAVLAGPLADEIQALLRPYGEKAAFSVRGPGGEELMQVRGQTLYAPASVAKSVSTACSLWELGPQYQFETSFGYRGKVQNGKLTGDLIIQGSGDPSMVTEQIREVIEKIRHVYRIKTIQGQIIFDVSFLGTKTLTMAEGFGGDAGRSFATMLTPLPLNQNSFSFWAAPNLESLKQTNITILPRDVMDIKVKNQVKVGASSQVSAYYNPELRSASLGGTASRDGDLRGVYRAAPDVYEYYFNLIRQFWTDAGGTWEKPSYKIETSAVTSTPLLKHSSKYLSQILMDINKFSLNLGAEMVLLTAGANKLGTPATYEKSKTLLGNCLKEFGVNEGGIELSNASGLSRDSKMKPSELTKFLMNYWKHPYSPEYLSSLSLLGLDGTAKSRLTKFAGRGRVKTGTLKDVHTIAGFLFDEDHRPYSFALFFNDVSMGNPALKKTEDRVMELLLERNFRFSMK